MAVQKIIIDKDTVSSILVPRIVGVALVQTRYKMRYLCDCVEAIVLINDDGVLDIVHDDFLEDDV